MKLDCPKCGASGQMDDAKIPAGGANIRCPRCNERFFVSKPQAVSEAPPLAFVSAQPEADQPLGLEQPAAAAAEPRPPAGFQELCSICKTTHPRTDMLRFGDTWVCAKCKPSYLQMLQQGLQRPGYRRYGGFWIRFAAKFIDGLIVAVPMLVVYFLAWPSDMQTITPDQIMGTFMTLMIANIIIPTVYTIFFVGKYQATPGKMACGLTIITADGGRVSYLRALGRFLAEIISQFILYIGYIMAAFDQEKRALHDRICDTRVVYK